MKLVLRPGGRLAGGVYPGGGGDMTGNPVMPPKQRNVPYYLLYRDIQVKLENCKWLFQTENMDRFLIKWYFYYHKGGEFYMVLKNSEKILSRCSKSLSKPDFPFFNYTFSFNLIHCML